MLIIEPLSPVTRLYHGSMPPSRVWALILLFSCPAVSAELALIDTDGLNDSVKCLELERVKSHFVCDSTPELFASLSSSIRILIKMLHSLGSFELGYDAP